MFYRREINSVVAAKLFLSIFVCLAAGMLGSLATASSVETWYPTLAKPGFTPPAWVFGPVWTVLYLLMGIALFRIIRKPWFNKPVQVAAGLFMLQLVLNVIWSFIFFGARNPSVAFAELCLLWLAIAATMWAAYRVDTGATWLLAPYLAWVTYAGVLNFAIAIMNP